MDQVPAVAPSGFRDVATVRWRAGQCCEGRSQPAHRHPTFAIKATKGAGRVGSGEGAASRAREGKAADDLTERIVDAALAMAETDGWDGVRLQRIAADLGIDMAGIAVRFRDRDAIADAWFARARAAMLAPPPADFAAAPAVERLFVLMMRFLDALAVHRRVTVAMLQVKLWPFHPHHWLPMLFELSRIVLWWRDAAGLDAPPPRREIEEIALTWLFLATLAVWANDATTGQERTRRFLRRRLAEADALAQSRCLPHAKPRLATNDDPHWQDAPSSPRT